MDAYINIDTAPVTFTSKGLQTTYEPVGAPGKLIKKLDGKKTYRYYPVVSNRFQMHGGNVPSHLKYSQSTATSAQLGLADGDVVNEKLFEEYDFTSAASKEKEARKLRTKGKKRPHESDEDEEENSEDNIDERVQ